MLAISEEADFIKLTGLQHNDLTVWTIRTKVINGKDETIMSALVDEDEGCKSSWSNVIIAKEALSLWDIVHPYATYNEEN